jgi:hypothetical protein
MQLWKHQRDALLHSIDNDFASGTHAHATGSGKSILGHSLIRAFSQEHPQQLMMWLCEQTSVIAEIFSRKDVRKGMLVCDLVSNKPQDWWWHVQSALVWQKPVLIIVNRAFLVSQKRYEKLKRCKIGLILHDECHSGVGPTTKAFYDWLSVHHRNTRVIGLSATPPVTKDAPHPCLSNILTRYSIYDATMAKTIVPLRIYWSPKEEVRRAGTDARLTLDLAEHHNVMKIIVWCGTIQHCYDSAKAWQSVFRSSAHDWTICADTSQTAPTTTWGSYTDFSTSTTHSILFCAAKHREGSDIAGLGMGVFVDGVKKRGSTVFVQCAGRVLRKSVAPFPTKQFGLLLDLQAKDGMELCDRVGEYLQLPRGQIPWTFNEEHIGHTTLQSLQLSPVTSSMQASAPSIDHAMSPPSLTTLFIRDVPEDDIYHTRLDYEMTWIHKKELEPHLIRALDVLKLAGQDVPHVTRGSSGSSLVCYLLGISHVDPVKHNICFARFLNEYRESLPDIDFDFPHNKRSNIFLRMALKWKGKVARISNHVHFHEKSALREALRMHGHKTNIAANDLDNYIRALPWNDQEAIKEEAKMLDGEFNCYSLHCGGVVYYPKGIPDEAVLQGKESKLLTQVHYDKRDISGEGLFKIDVLSSRALAQLFDALEVTDARHMHLEAPPFTQEVKDLLASGGNIGVTLAESPLCRQEFVAQCPESVEDVAKCLALIRPAARESKGVIVYDDDAIVIIAKMLNCSEAKADAYRRGLAKRDTSTLKEIRANHGQSIVDSLQDQLGSLSQYGFCKAHAMSYAQLVTWLAWCKIERPQAFWKGALNHCHSSYKKWVHLWEAWQAGVDPFSSELLRNNVSVYAESRRNTLHTTSKMTQLKQLGYWDVRKGFMPSCYCKTDDKKHRIFRGVIAMHRRLSKKSLSLCVGYGDGYLDFVCHGVRFKNHYRLVSGRLDEENVGHGITFY